MSGSPIVPLPKRTRQPPVLDVSVDTEPVIWPVSSRIRECILDIAEPAKPARLRSQHSREKRIKHRLSRAVSDHMSVSGKSPLSPTRICVWVSC